ncbi:hypothetical protein SFR_7062 (plasmid) [Streptomyces sp. FR-008]|nr:hypothetical protein SFR_7062 [Streptomyces sp. FR-008]
MGGEPVAVGQGPGGFAGLTATELRLREADGGGHVGLPLACELHEGGDSETQRLLGTHHGHHPSRRMRVSHH